MDAPAWLELDKSQAQTIVRLGGVWDIRQAVDLDRKLRGTDFPRDRNLVFDGAGLERLDSAGAWLLHRTIRDAGEAGATVQTLNLRDDHRAMLAQIADNDRPCEIAPERASPLIRILSNIGANTVDSMKEARALIEFLGLTVASIFSAIVMPWRLRVTPLFHHMERVGFNAVPIVSLISFLIGVVLAYQGATQLQRFGAEIFVVDLIAISVLREIGILLTAIVVAGRSGSAFTAEIGSMVVNEEVDAMRSLGLDPMEVLVVPRILALVIMLPILAFIADIMGLLGGFVMCWTVLGISPGLFLEQLNNSASLWTFGVGIIKAPFFAFMIAYVGCFEGLRVSRNAASVGARTTRSVVTSIFLIIVADAVFSILFAIVGV